MPRWLQSAARLLRAVRRGRADPWINLEAIATRFRGRPFGQPLKPPWHNAPLSRPLGIHGSFLHPQSSTSWGLANTLAPSIVAQSRRVRGELFNRPKADRADHHDNQNPDQK